MKRILVMLALMLLALGLSGCKKTTAPEESSGPIRASVVLGTWNYDENGYQLASADMGSHVTTDEAEYRSLKTLISGIQMDMTETDYTFLTGYLITLYTPEGEPESQLLVGTTHELASRDGLVFTAQSLAPVRQKLSALLEANQ